MLQFMHERVVHATLGILVRQPQCVILGGVS
jgi:hypothetical protein